MSRTHGASFPARSHTRRCDARHARQGVSRAVACGAGVLTGASREPRTPRVREARRCHREECFGATGGRAAASRRRAGSLVTRANVHRSAFRVDHDEAFRLGVSPKRPHRPTGERRVAVLIGPRPQHETCNERTTPRRRTWARSSQLAARAERRRRSTAGSADVADQRGDAPVAATRYSQRAHCSQCALPRSSMTASRDRARVDVARCNGHSHARGSLTGTT